MREVFATLKWMGFKEVHRKGSHVKMKYPDGRKIVFPYHNDIDRFTLFFQKVCQMIGQVFQVYRKVHIFNYTAFRTSKLDWSKV